MYAQLANSMYFPNLKWKQGESWALASTPPQLRRRITPMFSMPPSGGYDHATGRFLGPLEHIKTMARLYSSWGNQVAFIDAKHLDDKKHREALPRHPLTELLERARSTGGLACPSTALDRSEDYQNAVARFVRKHEYQFPISIRLSGGDLEQPTLRMDLDSLLKRLECPPSRSVLVVDLADVTFQTDEELDALCNILVERINELPFLTDWLNVVVVATAFPAKIDLKAGDLGIYPRLEWSLYKRLFDMRSELLRMPAYGDYAVENPAQVLPINVPPSAQLRYTTEAEHLIFKGKTTRKPYGYQSIFPVADRLIADDRFMGAKFSRGDAYIVSLADHRDTGYAPKWRWASTDHHFSLVLKGLGQLIGVSVEVEEDVNLHANQLALFDNL